MITAEQRQAIIAALQREIARLDSGEDPGCITAMYPVFDPELWLETPPDDSDLEDVCLDECEWHVDVESSEWGVYVPVRRAAVVSYEQTCRCSRYDYGAVYGFVDHGHAELTPPDRTTCVDCEDLDVESADA